MLRNIKSYKAIIFDCDGVVLKSNKIKTEAFRKVASPFGLKATNNLIKHHTLNGGISRYKKFIHFIEEILPNFSLLTELPTIAQLLTSYSNYVVSGLLECEVSQYLVDLKDLTNDIPWLIVSGGDQTELRDVFSQRNLSYLFESGIFGSPDTKEEIIIDKLSRGIINNETLFIGDSKYDFEVAKSFGLDFVFLSDWTEVDNWKDWVIVNEIYNTNNIESLIENWRSL